MTDTEEKISDRIAELINGLEMQKKHYQAMIREQISNSDQSFFCGKLAGIFDEIEDLNWILNCKTE